MKWPRRVYVWFINEPTRGQVAADVTTRLEVAEDWRRRGVIPVEYGIIGVLEPKVLQAEEPIQVPVTA